MPAEALVYTLAEWQALSERSPRFAETLRREVRRLLHRPALTLSLSGLGCRVRNWPGPPTWPCQVGVALKPPLVLGGHLRGHAQGFGGP